MNRAGFVLVGGKSSRMGQNKAFLPIGSGTLLGRVALAVQSAAGSATLVGDIKTYSRLGFPVIPDEVFDAGPLAGICSALRAGADWNLIVACDMPALSVDVLRELLDEAERTGCDCAIPRNPAGRLEPLCGVYHRRCLPVVQTALENGIRKVTSALTGLRIHHPAVHPIGSFENLNTPQDWTRFLTDARMD